MTGLELMRQMAAQESRAVANRLGTGRGKLGGTPDAPQVTSKQVAHSMSVNRLKPAMIERAGRLTAEGLGYRAIARQFQCDERLAKRYVEAALKERVGHV